MAPTAVCHGISIYFSGAVFWEYPGYGQNCLAINMYTVNKTLGINLKLLDYLSLVVSKNDPPYLPSLVHVYHDVLGKVGRLYSGTTNDIIRHEVSRFRVVYVLQSCYLILGCLDVMFGCELFIIHTNFHPYLLNSIMWLCHIQFTSIIYPPHIYSSNVMWIKKFQYGQGGVIKDITDTVYKEHLHK